MQSGARLLSPNLNVFNKCPTLKARKLNTFKVVVSVEPKLLMYLAYLVISGGLTVAVAHALFRYGKVFLTDVFGDAKLADSVNHLLVVGFYLISLGYVATTIRFDAQAASASHAVELLSLKIGWVLLGLGALHLVNLYVLAQIRKRRLAEGALPTWAAAGDPATGGHPAAGGDPDRREPRRAPRPRTAAAAAAGWPKP